MSIQLHAVAAGEREAVSRLLLDVFGLPPGSPFVDPRLMQWKYFEPLPGWSGPRSWAMKEGRDIVAHIGEWPFHFAGPGGLVDCVHLIDWGADPGSPGAGVQLYAEMLRRHSAALVLGGSYDARKLLAKLGFRQVGTLDGLVKVVRPWKQFRSRPERRFLRDSAKLARNLAWSRVGKCVPDPRWSSKAVDVFPDSLGGLFEDGQADVTAERRAIRSHRSPAVLNYLLSCPGANCRGFLVYCDGLLRGYFLTSRFAGQSRLADLRIAPGGDRDFRDALTHAVATAVADAETCELLVPCSSALSRETLELLGFRLRSQKPIWLYDPKSALGPAPCLHIQPVDSDAFFLTDVRDPFLT
jgi:hypothetical protein